VIGYPIWQGTFLPYGQEWNPQLTTNHCKFAGKERDAESGLGVPSLRSGFRLRAPATLTPAKRLNFGARFYSSAMGRWMSPDWADKPEPVPYADLSDPQSLNLYSYVRNNPRSKAGADGHCDSICAWNVFTALQPAVTAFIGALADEGRALVTDPRAPAGCPALCL
jgi:RHS repeat-associated protein